MLSIDFYESGKGETIILTFPDGSLGVVDAHPSPSSSRPAIEELVRGKVVEFVCLTHPHQDHGADLVNVLSAAKSVNQFWHSVSDIQTLVYSYTEQKKFPDIHSDLIEDLRKKWANFLLNLYSNIATRLAEDPSFISKKTSSSRSEEIQGVQISFLSPEESELNRYFSKLKGIIEGKKLRKPNENHLSIVIQLDYGKSSLLLGADAEKRNWTAAIKNSSKWQLPRNRLLKVPHHGASNSLSTIKKRSYLKSLCDKQDLFSILFAGDSKHPNPSVFEALKNQSTLLCLRNGLKNADDTDRNPLNIDLEGAEAYGEGSICNPVISFEVWDDGRIVLKEGEQCDHCNAQTSSSDITNTNN